MFSSQLIMYSFANYFFFEVAKWWLMVAAHGLRRMKKKSSYFLPSVLHCLTIVQTFYCIIPCQDWNDFLTEWEA